MIEVLPTTTQDNMRSGAELAQTAMSNALLRLVNEFPELKDILKPVAQKELDLGRITRPFFWKLTRVDLIQGGGVGG